MCANLISKNEHMDWYFNVLILILRPLYLPETDSLGKNEKSSGTEFNFFLKTNSKRANSSPIGNRSTQPCGIFWFNFYPSGGLGAALFSVETHTDFDVEGAEFRIFLIP